MKEDYRQCKILCKLEKEDTPLVTKVPLDDINIVVDECFDYKFDGVSKFYPYKFPNIDFDYHILAIIGKSGSGKTIMSKQIKGKHFAQKTFDNSKSIVSNFKDQQDAIKRLSAVGLMSIPTWVRPYNVLSVGESFRANIALNIEDNIIFDEFTSTIDRNVAKSCCNSLSKYIHSKDIKGVVVCSCHKDFIEYLRPDVVIDLDDEVVYDCREEGLGKQLTSTSSKQKIEACGGYLGTITICLHN